MTAEKVQYIKSITIKKLWGKVNIDWQLDPKVNILVGKNGTGKSTILNIIESMITKNEIYNDLEIEELIIKFSRNSIDFWPDYEYTFLKNAHIGEKDYENFTHTANYEFVSKYVKLFKISTFEMPIQEIKEKDFLFNKNNYSKTELDLVLFELINDFKSYQLTLRKLIESKILVLDNEIKALSSQESVTNQELIKLRELLKQKDEITANINYTKNVFLDLVNQLFSETNKKIDFDENNSIIFQQPDNQIISTYQLSSGEKQILIILLTVVIQQNKPCIFLMDEPELSLHLSWQHKLIDMIQLLNNNCQLIIVTHAAGIFSKGWMDKVIKIDNIINH